MKVYEIDDKANDPMVAKFLDEVERNCSDIIAVIQSCDTFLWRGVVNPPKPFYKTQPRTNRAPLNTPQVIHQAVDNWMVEHGYEARRSNSVFVSSSITVADNYGQSFFIFPANGFKYTWFEASHDLYDEIPMNIYDLHSNPAFVKNFMPGQVDKWLKGMGPRKDNIKEAIIGKKELMISDADVYLISRRDYFHAVCRRFDIGD